MFIFINIILGVILSVFTIIFIVKKIIVGIVITDSGLIISVLILLGVVGLFCSLSALLGAHSIDGLAIRLNTDKVISAEEITMIKQNISKSKTTNIISLIVGYVALIFNQIIYTIMAKKHKQAQAKVKNRWDWSKLN
ncbi:hypothetical protein [Clostridium sp. FP1]|uniref:hypothetical protein n=1 Tax=Clostridium sp. FP1 TaxID=2724076 RepID=UPI0013E96EAC|nr:hypothetical protein [Clostridium sp. FP1]MBZ9635029.1 hypothetical protein [Clostridium sp. FP1]